MVSAAPPLAVLGWDQSWNHHHLDVDPEARWRPARVTLQGRDVWRVHDGDVETNVGVRGRLRSAPASLPVAGDWVLVGGTSADDAVIEHLLPRRSSLTRKAAGQRTDEQVVAANVDVVLVCAPAHSLNARRLERELTIVWESGATPYVVVTKSDLLGGDLAETLDEVRGVAVGAEVLAVSSYDGDGLDAVRELMPAGITGAVIGPSGAGKSTLVNALVGHELLATTAVRSDHRGVHTTSARHLVPLPDGGLVLDTPGMRELALWADEEALDHTFADVEAVTRECRFSDCAHDGEPGCAVAARVADGTLDEMRVASWRKLQRELAYLARKQDVRAQHEERRRWARISREARARTRP
jgi:ribosome biogenesis GTPase